MAVAVLFTTSCAKEDISSSIANGEQVEVTFTANLPELGTRAESYGNASAVDKVYVKVYDANTDEFLSSLTLNGGYPVVEKKATVNIALVKGMKYNIVFWAQSSTCGCYTFNDNKTITISYNGAIANDDTRDAFFAYVDEFDPVTPAGKDQVKLYRPFAQLNAATNDKTAVVNSGVDFTTMTSTVKLQAYNKFDITKGTIADDAELVNVEFAATEVPATSGETIKAGYEYLSMNYILVPADKNLFDVEFIFKGNRKDNGPEVTFTNTSYTSVPLQRNYRTNILGSLLTKATDFNVEILPGFGGDYEVEGETVTAKVDTAEEFVAAFENDSNVDVVVLDGDINLNDLFASLASTRAADTTDPSLTINSGKTLTIDLNGKKLTAVTEIADNNGDGKITANYDNQIIFNVIGTLTVKNGTIEYKHEGENMGWNASTNIFNITAGGILNLEGVTAKNLGGSDMAFVAHLNNWGEVTLNVDNCTLESNYVPVRVFNSGPDMNNVTIKNSTLNGVSAAFWVHNYTAVDFGTEAKAEAQKALLNLNIYNQGNTFSPDLNGIRYGFTNSIRTDAYGITKVVSEDGTEVTLGSIINDGLIRRGVAGAEENTTIKKAIVGEGVTTLYDRTFRRFYALETVELPSTLTTIGYAGSGVFQSCTALKNIVLPESVTILGEGTFQECTSLESINIPAGVTRIEADCLRATGLKEVEFHAGVTYFGAMAFRDCKQLTKVVINAPEFTMEGDTFGIMAAPFTPMTIEVANAEMKAYVESKLTAHAKTYITVVAPELIDNTADLQAALAKGEYVALANDLTISLAEMMDAPYGNKTVVSHKGGVFNGNGKTISCTAGGDHYVVMTAGGTIKNLTIDNGFRGVVIMSPTQTVYLENVVSGGKGVCYALNTAEGDYTQDVVATNCTFNGWSSWSNIKSATFTNCTFGQGAYYTNVSGRLGKPYVNTVFDGCNFCSKYYIDLSALNADQKVIVKNCSVNGVKITAENWTSLVAPESTCGEGQISVELKNGTYLTAENVADYIVFE